VAARALSIAAFEAISLAIAASFLTGCPATSRAAASYQASRAACTRASMSATVNWIPHAAGDVGSAAGLGQAEGSPPLPVHSPGSHRSRCPAVPNR
jgi:hypothetical protein